MTVAPFFFQDGKVTELPRPTIDGDMTIADLNDRNQFVGGIGITTPFLFTDGTYQFLSLLPGASSGQVTALNNSGVAVGWSWNNTRRAVVFEDGVAIDLNTLIAGASDVLLTDATAINDHGQIVANGTLNGRQRVFLLTPITSVPEPGSFALSFCALAGIAVLRPRVSRIER